MPPYNGAALSAIVGGVYNTIGSPRSFIGSGQNNSIIANAVEIGGQGAFIGAGEFNSTSGTFSSIVAGRYNSVSADDSAVAGGASNTVSGQYSAVGGGLQNTVAGEYGTIAGGYDNVASGIQASVGGGYGNTATGRNAAIPGGAYNFAGGLDSFAAGNAAKAAHNGTFVWSDYSAVAGITSSAVNQFLARAAGGFYLYSSATLSTGVRLAPGSGSWSSVSDRAAKTAIADVDEKRILAKVAALPVSEWSYSAQGTGIRHLGPMAQDFRAAFGLGEDDKHISTVDEEGVALAAIKALQSEVSAKDRQIAELRRVDEARFSNMEKRLTALEASRK